MEEDKQRECLCKEESTEETGIQVEEKPVEKPAENEQRTMFNPVTKGISNPFAGTSWGE